MKKIVRLKESDLVNLVKKLISEQKSGYFDNLMGDSESWWDDFKKSTKNLPIQGEVANKGVLSRIFGKAQEEISWHDSDSSNSMLSIDSDGNVYLALEQPGEDEETKQKWMMGNNLLKSMGINPKWKIAHESQAYITMKNQKPEILKRLAIGITKIYAS